VGWKQEVRWRMKATANSFLILIIPSLILIIPSTPIDMARKFEISIPHFLSFKQIITILEAEQLGRQWS